MSNKVSELLTQITRLEDELRVALSEQPSSIFFQINGKRIKFEKSIKKTHQKLKTNFFRWLVTNRPQNLITGPMIYSMIIPLVIADVFITIYQITCFPVYGIKKVSRNDYIIFDRQYLNYLNFIEKFHCSYCAYGAGVVAYINEIVARTEQYFCPIKHARKILATHQRYIHFLDYGDAEHYEEKLESYRKLLNDERNKN
jgi:hypothetical protein